MSIQRLILDLCSFFASVVIILVTPTMLVWNLIMPYIFGFEEIGFREAFVLLLIIDSIIDLMRSTSIWLKNKLYK